MNGKSQPKLHAQPGKTVSFIRKAEQMRMPRSSMSRNLQTILLTLACFFAVGCGGTEQATTSQKNTAPSQADNAADEFYVAPEAEQEIAKPAAPAAKAPDPSLIAGGSEAAPADAMQSPDQPGEVDKQNIAAAPNSGISSPTEPPSGPAGFGASSRAQRNRNETKPKDNAEDAMAESLNSALGMEETDVKESVIGGRGLNLERALKKKSELSIVSDDVRFGVNEQREAKSNAGQPAASFDLQPGEELWIIAKPAENIIDDANNSKPRCGTLMATLPSETVQVPVPLKHTSVKANVDGYIATVDVQQQFHNPYDSKIEATYIFPLPHSAAVNEFVMTIGDRKIRGIIREREKAEKIYEAAKNQGHVASLMTQERANIFTQKVANIEPGKQIDINIRYFNTLQYDDGSYEFVFPMVVGPRYNPPGSTDGVGAVTRHANGSSGQQTEVSYLAPNERSGHDISLQLIINAGVNIEDIHCVNHLVDEQPVSETQRKVTLSSKDSIPNKDFVLRYKVAGDQIKTAILTHEDNHGKYFTMMMYPPADLQQVERSPMEMVFVLDCSGSMRGKPLGQAKNAVAHALQTLTPRDTFQIIQFSSNSSQLGAEPVIANEQNIQAGLKYLYSLNGGGGTQMIEGIKAALDFPHDEGRFRLVSFMTDGFIGNEPEILRTLNKKLGASRIFSFGVGSSPNRMLMDRMAILGKGAVAYLSLNDDAVDIMDRFNKRISHPAMTDLQIDWGTMDVADVYPKRLPDLIVGRPVIVTGRFKGEPGVVKVNGRVAMQPASFDVGVDGRDASNKHAGVAAVWARLKIKAMMNTATTSPQAFDEIKASVIETAVTYSLMSSFTAFVAVDSLSQTEGELGSTVAVPVSVPDGVQYETTVGDGSDE